VGRENTFKLKIGNDSLHQESDNGVRIVNFAITCHILAKISQTAFPTFGATWY